jgi:hypothetical protein
MNSFDDHESSLRDSPPSAADDDDTFAVEIEHFETVAVVVVVDAGLAAHFRSPQLERILDFLSRRQVSVYKIKLKKCLTILFMA